MRIVMAAAFLLAALGSAGSATAQTSQTAVEGRVDRLEREMRAVQRKVFPGGAGQYFEPQITAEQPQQTTPGVPASSAVADLTARVAALESQIASITGQVEQSQYRVGQLETAFDAYKRATDARLKALEAGPATLDSTTPEVSVPAPASGDPAEDAYLYGFRLWSAKFYPEARRELQVVVDKYPTHRRWSFAKNLIGRSYLDANAPSMAAVVFYENYKKNPEGERAPDSLYYLAQALVKLKKPNAEVCRVYDQLTSNYGERLSEQMKNDVAAGRIASKCGPIS